MLHALNKNFRARTFDIAECAKFFCQFYAKSHFFLSIYISDSGLLPGRLSLPSNIPVGKQKHQQY